MAILSRKYHRSKEEINLLKWQRIYEQMKNTQLSKRFFELSKRKVRLERLARRIKYFMENEKQKIKKRRKNAITVINNSYNKNDEILNKRETMKIAKLKGNEYSKNNLNILGRLSRKFSTQAICSPHQETNTTLTKFKKKSKITKISSTNMNNNNKNNNNTINNNYKMRVNYGNSISRQNMSKTKSKPMNKMINDKLNQNNKSSLLSDAKNIDDNNKRWTYGSYYTIRNKLQEKDNSHEFDEEYHKLLLKCVSFEKNHLDVTGFLEEKLLNNPEFLKNIFNAETIQYNNANIKRKCPRIDYFTINDIAKPLTKINDHEFEIISQQQQQPIEVFVSCTKISTFLKPSGYNNYLIKLPQLSDSFTSEKILKTLKYTNDDPLVTYNQFNQSSSFNLNIYENNNNFIDNEMKNTFVLEPIHPKAIQIHQNHQNHHNTIRFEKEFEHIFDLIKNKKDFHHIIIDILNKCKISEFSINDYTKVFFDLYLVFTLSLIRNSLNDDNDILTKENCMSQFKELAIQNANLLSKSFESFFSLKNR